MLQQCSEEQLVRLVGGHYNFQSCLAMWLRIHVHNYDDCFIYGCISLVSHSYLNLQTRELLPARPRYEVQKISDSGVACLV